MLTNPRYTSRYDELKMTAREARRLIIETIHRAQAGHLGGPLSATDILVALYFDVMQLDPARPEWPERDRFILSKGHSSVALYVTLALRGYFPVEELATFDRLNSRLQGHPDMSALPGIEMSTGSLGQGLSPGVGMAIGAKRRGLPFRTFVLLGDGELQEGQVWEAAFVAARYGLGNLTAIIDHNRLPQYRWPGAGAGEEADLPETAERWRAFGWAVRDVDGHDYEALIHALQPNATDSSQPTAIIAHTIKGKGVSFMEGDYLWHARPLTDAQRDAAMAELSGGFRD